MLCSKLHCQTGFDLIPVSFKVGRPERGGGDSRLGGDGWRDGTPPPLRRLFHTQHHPVVCVCERECV